MLATYANRVTAHATRTGAQRSTSLIRLLIIHTSEGGEGDISAENLASFISTPRTATNLASYHYITDTDRVIPVVPDNYVAYATGGANSDGLAICHPGKAGQSTEQWHDRISTDMREQAARWLADKSKQYDIPLVKLTPADIVAGKRGVCGHWDVSLAYKKSTHTDPGPNYPWAELIARANTLANPLPAIPAPPEGDDDMAIAQVIFHQPGQDAYYVCWSDATKRPLPSIHAVGHLNALRSLSQLPQLGVHEVGADDPMTWEATGPVLGGPLGQADKWGLVRN